MLPPPGFQPTLTSLLDNAMPTTLLSTAIATTSALLSLGVDDPTATFSSAVATITSIAEATQYGDQPPPPDSNGECRLLGPFAILVQGSLGLLALLALVYKRWRERPQRPVKIWFFDVSKQVVGSVLVHFANLVMSLLSSGQFSLKVEPTTIAQRMIDSNGNYKPNPCSFYLLNLAIDTTVGIPILIFLLRIFTALFALTPIGEPRESIQSGHYGSPPKKAWWFKQSLIYFLGLMGMKLCVLVIFLVLPWISRIGDWALRWTEGDEALQVIFVMLIFPVIMNATQYYIIDSFIKNQKPEHERIPDEDHDEEVFREEDVSGSSDEIRSEEEDDDKAVLTKKTGQNAEERPVGRRKMDLRTGQKDYDPLYDGESSPTVVASPSTSSRRLVHTADGEEQGQSGDEEEGRKGGSR